MAYRAWNGTVYEGDPPSGWFLAVDGRWWPPDHLDAPAAQSVEPDPARPEEPRHDRSRPRPHGRHTLLPDDQRGPDGPVAGRAPFMDSFEDPAPRPADQASAGHLPPGPFVPDKETMPIDPNRPSPSSTGRSGPDGRSDPADADADDRNRPRTSDRLTEQRTSRVTVNPWALAAGLTAAAAFVVNYMLG